MPPVAAPEQRLRRIDSLEISRADDFIIIDVNGNGFLRNMIRIIAGTLVEAGRGSLSPEDIPELLNGRTRVKGGDYGPSQGLCLMEVFY
ncbi:MAG: hypothetical protein MZU91_10330 [Desulfosudis oleivorans]|nr:hypothetical protein [Desulfosudis oleivorans]